MSALSNTNAMEASDTKNTGQNCLCFCNQKKKKILYFGAYYLLLDLTSNYSDVFTSAAVACKRARSSFSLPMNHSSHGERLSFKGDWFLTPAISESSAFLN